MADPASEKILLITSTIAPAAEVFLLKIRDAESRLQEYCTAFRFYLGLLEDGVINRIVYADNSGHTLQALQQIAGQSSHVAEVEFLSFRQDPAPLNSRYVLEMDLIRTAMRVSAILDDTRPQIVWKITGRYIISNAGKIIAGAPEQFDLYANFRNHPQKVLDFYLIGFRTDSYRNLLGFDPDHYRDTPVAGEILLRQRIDAGDFDGLNIQRRFRVTPRISAGRRGFDGNHYGGARDTTKYIIRWIANGLLPRLWM